MGSQAPNRLSLPLTINLLQHPWLWKELQDTPNKPLSVYKYTVTYRLQRLNPCGLAVRAAGVDAAPEQELELFILVPAGLRRGRRRQSPGLAAWGLLQ